MRKVSLIMMVLTFAFVGLQSFVNERVETSEKTVLTSVDENWSIDGVEGTDQVLAKAWFVAACITPQGLPGTICLYTYPNGNPTCTGSKNKVPCSANL